MNCTVISMHMMQPACRAQRGAQVQKDMPGLESTVPDELCGCTDGWGEDGGRRGAAAVTSWPGAMLL